MPASLPRRTTPSVTSKKWPRPSLGLATPSPMAPTLTRGSTTSDRLASPSCKPYTCCLQRQPLAIQTASAWRCPSPSTWQRAPSPPRNRPPRRNLCPPAPSRSSTPPGPRLLARLLQRRPPRPNRHHHPIALGFSLKCKAQLMHDDLEPLLNDSVFRALDTNVNASI
jgi:hypothetical protein